MDEKYFVARVTTDMVDENTGKVKKNERGKTSQRFFTNRC